MKDKIEQVGTVTHLQRLTATTKAALVLALEEMIGMTTKALQFCQRTIMGSVEYLQKHKESVTV